MSIAREGWPIIAALVVPGVALLVFRYHVLGAVFLLLGFFTLYFFRDPERKAPDDPRLVLSPADGKVVLVGPAPEGNPVGPGATQISVFLSVFDVHINRAPIAGRIAQVEYRKGEFLPAFNHDASQRNEQNAVTIENGAEKVHFRQIAGLIARRIVFRKAVGDDVRAGERVGMIKFGSRVDILLPGEIRIRVKKGDRVRGGLSALGERP
jgi:phosphatidylserine decarboxylase